MEGLFLPKQFWLQRTIEKIGMVKILQHSQKKVSPKLCGDSSKLAFF